MSHLSIVSHFYQCHVCGNPTGCFKRLCAPIQDHAYCDAAELASKKYSAEWKELKQSGRDHAFSMGNFETKEAWERIKEAALQAENNAAVELLQQAKGAYNKGKLATWYYENQGKVNAAIARSLPMENGEKKGETEI